jgi:transposase
VSRRANALILLNDGWSCAGAEVAAALLMDDDTVRSWHKLYVEQGLAGLVLFHQGGSEGHLTCEQEAELAQWVRETLPARRSSARGSIRPRSCKAKASHISC